MNEHLKADTVGTMRHRVKVYAYSISRNVAGEEVLTWSEKREVWAAVQYLEAGSDEETQAGRQTARTAAKVRMRYRMDLNEKMRLVFDYKGWDIRSIIPDAHRQYMTLEVEDFQDDAWDATIAPGLLLDDEGDPLFDDNGDPLLG